jgi:hypothetical protein
MDKKNQQDQPPVADEPRGPEQGQRWGDPGKPDAGEPDERPNQAGTQQIQEVEDNDLERGPKNDSGFAPANDDSERPGTDWGRTETESPNIQPENFPGAERSGEEPGTPGLDPNPNRPNKGRDEPDFPEGPERKPERYPNPQQPQDPEDRPPVEPQGSGAGEGDASQPQD